MRPDAFGRRNIEFDAKPITGSHIRAIQLDVKPANADIVRHAVHDGSKSIAGRTGVWPTIVKAAQCDGQAQIKPPVGAPL